MSMKKSNESYTKLSVTVKCGKCGNCFKRYDNTIMLLIQNGMTTEECPKCGDKVNIIKFQGKPGGLAFKSKSRKDGRTDEELNDIILKLDGYGVPKYVIRDTLKICHSRLKILEDG